MKKWLTIPLALSLVLSLGACGGKTASAEPASTTGEVAPTQAPAPSPEPGAPVPADSVPEEENSVAEETQAPEELEIQGPTITAVTYGASYVETAATDDDTVNSPSASSNVSAVTLSDGTEVTAEHGGVLTLVIDGDQYDIPDYYHSGKKLPEGQFSFETTAGTEAWSEMGKFMNMAGQTAQYTYRSALKVGESGIVAEETIPALLQHVESYDEYGLRGGTLSSYGPFFNGIIVDSAPYEVGHVTITGEGDGANDFQGAGAMVLSQGTADVTLHNSVVLTRGTIRTAAAAKDSGILRIKNSVIYTEETGDTQAQYDALVVPMMKRTPFALGLEGTVRATNVLGAGQGIYSNSLIVSSGWGVLSTDSGNSYDQTGTYALDVSNTVAGTGTVEQARKGTDYYATRTVDGVEYGYLPGGSGYVAYADSGVFDRFDNVDFYGGNEVQIMASSNSSAFYTNSTLTSGHIGVMTQQNAGGTISIQDSALNVAETGVQIKSGAANNGYTNVVLDNTQVNFTADSKWGRTLVELVESDDAGNPGNTSYTVNDTGDEATTATATGQVEDSNAILKNGTYEGNIWNNIYNKYQALNVYLTDNATLSGTISSSYGYHLNDDGSRMENGTELTCDTTGNYLTSGASDYHKIGAQYNVANAQINNPVNVSLTKGSCWSIQLADGTCGEADACYIGDLTVDETSSITAQEPVTIHVYGTQDIRGDIDDNITIVQEEYTAPDCTTNTLTAVDMADPRHTATFVFVDENGDPAVGAASFGAYKAFAASYFTLAFNGYEMVSMNVTEGQAEIQEITPDDPDGYYGEYDYSISMETDCTVTVVVKAAANQGGPGGPPPM